MDVRARFTSEIKHDSILLTILVDSVRLSWPIIAYHSLEILIMIVSQDWKML